MKTKTPPQTIESLNSQIKALNKLILAGNTKNVYVLQNKIKSLKMVQILCDKYPHDFILSYGKPDYITI